MNEKMRFVVVAVDGEPTAIDDPCTQSLRYNDLTWEESVELARLSFLQGYAVIVWQVEGGSEECAKV